MTSWFTDRWGHYALLLTVVAVLCLPKLGAHSLWDWDEGFYCQVSREMLASGNWITPTFQHQLFAEKPVMLFWLQAISFLLLGIDEFSARLPSVLASALAVILTYEMGRKLFDRSTGLLAGVILASSAEFCLQAHAATPDAVLLFATAATFICFWIGMSTRHWRWYLLGGTAMGLALLVKGPVGLVIPILAIALYAAWSHQLDWSLGLRVAMAIVISVFVAAPWYIAVSLQTGNKFLEDFIGIHHIRRLLEPLQSHGGSFVYPVLGLCLFFSPWSTLLVPTLWQAVRGASGRRLLECESIRPQSPELKAHRLPLGRDLEPHAYRFLLSWMVAYLGLFSLAATKLPHYIFPIYPAIAILTARLMNRWRLEAGKVRCLPIAVASIGWLVVGIITTIALLVAGGALPMLFWKWPALQGLSAWWPIGIALLSGALFAWGAHLFGRRTLAVTALCVSASFYYAVLAAGPVMSLDRSKAPRALAVEYEMEFGAKHVRVACFNYFQPSMVFYFGVDLEQISKLDEALDLLRQPRPGCLILPMAAWQELRIGGNPRYRILGQSYDFYTGMEIGIVCNVSP